MWNYHFSPFISTKYNSFHWNELVQWPMVIIAWGVLLFPTGNELQLSAWLSMWLHSPPGNCSSNWNILLQLKIPWTARHDRHVARLSWADRQQFTPMGNLVASWPNTHIFGLWEENMQTLHMAPGWLADSVLGTCLLGANHYTTAPP